MSQTEEDIDVRSLPRRLVGYERARVEALVAALNQQVAEARAARDAAAAEVQSVTGQLEARRREEGLLREALVSAQRAAAEIREQARRESEELLESARREARELEQATRAERAQAEAEIASLVAKEQELRASYRVLLAAALERLEEQPKGARGPRPSLIEALAPRLREAVPAPEQPGA